MKSTYYFVLSLGFLFTMGKNFAYSQHESLSITPSSYWVDKSGESAIEGVYHTFNSGDFIRANEEHVNFGINDSVVWFTLNIDTRTEDLYISPGHESYVWKAAMYIKDSIGSFTKHSNYNHLSGFNQEGVLPFHTIGLRIPSNYNDNIFLRLSAERHKNFALKVGNLPTMLNYLRQKEVTPIAFMAIMLCIFIYNLFLFLSTRDLIFIPYLSYILIISIIVPFHGGFVLFPAEWMWQGMPFYMFWTGLGYLAGAVFAIQYLNLNRYAPKYNSWIILLLVILVLIIPALDAFRIYSFSVLSKFLSSISFVFYLSLLVAGIYAWVKGQGNAKYYVLGWIFALTSMMLFVLSVNGLISYSTFVEQSFYYGFAIEAVLFAFAIGGRVNTLRIEKHALEVKHVSYIMKQHKVLSKQSFMNSHLLRAPLTRILGLVSLLKNLNPKEKEEELMELMEQSALEMDGITKKIAGILEKEGLNEYPEDFEQVKKSIYKDLKGEGID